jgi:hypothetical protein
MPLMTVRATHVDSGVDFEIGPDASAADRDLTERLYNHISRTRRPDRHVVECREHDDSDDPELVSRRDPVDGRVHGILVYLRKLHEGTSDERWCVVHFDGRANHVVRVHANKQHQREQDAWAEAASEAGYEAEQEVPLPTGVRCDLLIRGPVALVDIEVQRSYLKKSSARARTQKAIAGGVSPIWSTDHITDWSRGNAVPNVRTNDLPVGRDRRDQWWVVGGLRDVLAEKCTPRNGSRCWTLGNGRFCYQYHPKLEVKLGVRVYEVAERAPAGDLVPLNTGPHRQGTVIVSPKDRDLYHELSEGLQGGVRIPSQRRSDQVPMHRQQLRQGFGAVIDTQSVHVPPQGVPAPAPSPSGPSALPCPYWGKGPCGWNDTPCGRCRYVNKQ